VVIEHKEDLTPLVEIYGNFPQGPFSENQLEEVVKSGKLVATYAIPTGAQIQVNEGDVIAPGGLIAKTRVRASRTQDITGGLPAWPSCSKLAARRKPPRCPRLTVWFRWKESCAANAVWWLPNEETGHARSI
jgi:hypothetical protein